MRFSILNHPFWGTHFFGNTYFLGHQLRCSKQSSDPTISSEEAVAVCADLANYGTTELPTAEFLTGGQVTGDPKETPGKNRGEGLGWAGGLV